MTQHLFLAQIGPVQSFIAQARRTKDLYVGSQMLSSLAVAAVESVSRTTGFQPIFPFVENGKVYNGISSHVFAFLTDEQPTAVADKIQAALTDHWMTTYANPVRDLLMKVVKAGGWEATFDRQSVPFPTDKASGWMEFYWVALPYEGSTHGEVYSRARIALSQRKSLRHFPAVEEHGVKCSLTGSQSALWFTDGEMNRIRSSITDPNRIILRDNERLGTLAMIKRLWPEVSTDQRAKRFLSTRAIAADKPGLDKERPDGSLEEVPPEKGREVEGYLAILHMDGDKMGVALSGLNKLEAHQDFSKNLADFSHEHVPDVINKEGGKAGRLVYAGGDDVLALLPLKHALKCADELQKAFIAHVGMGMTASAGVAITPIKLPLDFGLEMARKAESEAKEGYGRDAVAVTEAHGTGGLRHAGAKWDLLPYALRLQEAFSKDAGHIRVLSGKFPYDLADIAHLMQGAPVTAEMRKSEMHRVLNRRLDDRLSSADANAWVDYIGSAVLALAEPEGELKWNDATNWGILARFLASGGTRAGEEEQ